VQAPEVFRRVEVITLAVPNALVVKRLTTATPPAPAQLRQPMPLPHQDQKDMVAPSDLITAEMLVKCWKAGEAELLEIQTVNAGSVTPGIVQSTVPRYLYRGVRHYGGAGNKSVPEYEQREVGSRMQAILAANPNAREPDVSLDVSTEYIIFTELQFPKEREQEKEEVKAEKYPSVVTVKFSGKARLCEGYTLLGGGCLSPDNQTVLFLLARLESPIVIVP